MGRYISGTLKCIIVFSDVYVEDDQSDIDALFPDDGGWEGEMQSETWTLTKDEQEEEDED